MTDDDISLDSARAAAGRDDLGSWVAEFLASPGSDNAELGQQLAQRSLRWLGPVEIPLDQLKRLAGPRGHPVLQPVDDDEWRDDVDDLAAELEQAHDTAPVIATHHSDGLHLEDGNHRVEALRRAGAARAWTIIGFDSDAELNRFVERSDGSEAGR